MNLTKPFLFIAIKQMLPNVAPSLFIKQIDTNCEELDVCRSLHYEFILINVEKKYER